MDDLPGNRYRLLHSPAVVDGLANGDVIELDDSVACGFRLVSRGGNLAVVVVFEKPEGKRCAQTLDLTESVERIGGIAEGGPGHALVFSIPVGAGFPVVEKLFDEFVRALPGTTWWYGNVYEAGDPTRPLGWWNASK